MSWDTHINHIITRISKVVGILAKFHFFLPSSVKLLIYYALFASHLNYCLLVWGKTTLTNINCLHTLQKKALRHIAGDPFYAHTKPLFKRFNLISVPSLYAYTLALKYKQNIITPDKMLESIAQLTLRARIYPTRHTDIWSVPYSRTSYGTQMLRHTLHVLLNYLHENKINIENVNKKKFTCFFYYATAGHLVFILSIFCIIVSNHIDLHYVIYIFFCIPLYHGSNVILQ